MSRFTAGFRRMMGAGKTEKRELTWESWGAGGPMPGNVSVTAAQSLIPVFACWRMLADGVASLPVQTFQKNGATREPNAYLPDLLYSPASRDNLFQWLHKCVMSMVARGNAYGLVVERNDFGLPVTVEWLNPDEVWVDEERPTLPIYYWQGQVVPTENIIHIPWIVMPGRVVGLSPIQAFAKTIGVGLSATDYGRSWFDNGGTPPAILKNMGRTLTPAESRQASDGITQAMQARRPMVIGNDWTFEALQVNPQESQFIETQRLNASQIAAIYGCPPEKVGGESGGSLTYSTVELNALDFQSTTLRSWLVRLEYAISDVLPSREYMRFNLDGALRTDITTRYTAYGLALAQGWLNLDDIRALENKSPLPNGEGQKYGPAKPPQPALPAVRSAEAEAFLGMLMSERDVKHDA